MSHLMLPPTPSWSNPIKVNLLFDRGLEVFAEDNESQWSKRWCSKFTRRGRKKKCLIASPTSTGSVPYMSGKLILYPLLWNIQEFNSFFFFLWTDFIILPNGFWQKNKKAVCCRDRLFEAWQQKKKTINKILLINNWPVFNLWKWKIQ